MLKLESLDTTPASGVPSGRPSNFGGRLFVGGPRRSRAIAFSVCGPLVFIYDYMAVLLSLVWYQDL